MRVQSRGLCADGEDRQPGTRIVESVGGRSRVGRPLWRRADGEPRPGRGAREGAPGPRSRRASARVSSRTRAGVQRARAAPAVCFEGGGNAHPLPDEASSHRSRQVASEHELESGRHRTRRRVEEPERSLPRARPLRGHVSAHDPGTLGGGRGDLASAHGRSVVISARRRRQTRGVGAAGISSGRWRRSRALAAVISTPYNSRTAEIDTQMRNTTTAAI